MICPRGERLKFESRSREGSASTGGAALSLPQLSGVSGAGAVQSEQEGAADRMEPATRGADGNSRASGAIRPSGRCCGDVR